VTIPRDRIKARAEKPKTSKPPWRLPKTTASLAKVFHEARTAGDLVALEPMLTAFNRRGTPIFFSRVERAGREVTLEDSESPWKGEGAKTLELLKRAIQAARAQDPSFPTDANFWVSLDVKSDHG
jgi:hypothetical protein